MNDFIAHRAQEETKFPFGGYHFFLMDPETGSHSPRKACAAPEFQAANRAFMTVATCERKPFVLTIYSHQER